MIERSAIILLCLIDWTTACWDSSDIPLGLSDLNVYNIPVDPEHILKGPLYQLGDYDDCVYRRQQQYCFVNVYLHPGENASYFWQEKKRLSSLPMNHRRDRLFVGLCVPESCSSSQVEMAMYNKLRPAADHFGINATVVLESRNCQDRKKPYVFADYLMCVILLTVAALVIMGSLYEYKGGLLIKKNIIHGRVAQILICFSVINNWQRLCRVSSSPKFKSLHCIQGIRFFTSFFVIAGHEGFAMMMSPKQNPEWIETSYLKVERMLFVNGHLITCSFFVISGFMLAYQGMEFFDKSTFTLRSYLKLLAHRYIRLTPALAVVIVFVAGWMNHLGSGPIWPVWAKDDVDNCRQHWWVNLLYLNNYIFADKMCLLQTWYLAVDFQNFVLFFLLLGLINRYKLWINVTFGSILAICICIPVIQTYIEKLDPTFLTYMEHMNNLKGDKTFMRNYITFQHNAGPYFVGVIYGYFLYSKNTNGCKLSKFIVALLWTIGITLPLAVMLLGYFFYQPDFEYNAVIACIYAGLNKILFATGIATIILLCCMDFGGVIDKFLSCKLLQVLGRLTYSIYLTHPSLIRVEYASLKQSIRLTDYFMISKATVHTVFTIFFSLLLCLCAEMPISALFKLATTSKSEENVTPALVKVPNDKALEVEEQTQKQEEGLFQNIRL